MKRSIVKMPNSDSIPWVLPNVRGRYLFGQSLAAITWFKVGGNADVLFKPKDANDLAHFLKTRDMSMPITLLGAASNVLVRDGGIDGCVIKLGRGFSDITFENDKVIAGAACLDRTLVLECAAKGLTGLEFLVGIPGTLGGAAAMNAGAYGFEVKDYLVWVDVMHLDGSIQRLHAPELSMTYREGNLPKDTIVIQMCFQLSPGNPSDIQTLIQTNLQKREESQPIHGRTGGSTFKNPESNSKAWLLIDQAGCRGMRINEAQVSEMHCNFLLNTGNASAADLETLGETVRLKVQAETGTTLEWEIIRLGKK